MKQNLIFYEIDFSSERLIKDGVGEFNAVTPAVCDKVNAVWLRCKQHSYIQYVHMYI